MPNTIPTSEFYEVLQEIYQLFNKELFENTLPNCLITVQRKNNVMGYFSSERWVNNKGVKIHELALNPSYFSSCNFIEVFQTIVHEMCHLWQYEHGTPSRKTYHNKEWADKMESLGLMPSSTGLPGGSKTGQSMNDYPIKGGTFEKLCIKLFQDGLFIKWFDRFPNKLMSQIPFSQNQETQDQEIREDTNDQILENLYTVVSHVINDIVPIEEVKAMSQSKLKTKYTCAGCGASVWGKANLDLKCNSCEIDFMVSNDSE
ncbi:SprT-like domain-containing protein [Sulfurospirillum sp. hDNRA2]|uniref:SprT-like domain-containing protein n=1 Tax=Sulfurospirillum sp. hDNRA2 TaxID=3237298 RepID=UPI0020B819FC|nr:SprT-like domain-containing protein [Sulfurospirillum sp. DNRA8]MCP3653265.1 SprT-like domain-containing protein [Sulfurospirillum sp. DNRA8]MCR1812117.1 SprT-like domain-containing protein [Sulfurospirillum sp. DNRA8]